MGTGPAPGRSLAMATATAAVKMEDARSALLACLPHLLCSALLLLRFAAVDEMLVRAVRTRG